METCECKWERVFLRIFMEEKRWRATVRQQDMNCTSQANDKICRILAESTFLEWNFD